MGFFSQNVLLILLFLISGLIIQSRLKKLGMRYARGLFLVLFGLLLIYIPFYFGGNIMTRYFETHMPNAAFTEYFGFLMESLFAGPFLFMKTASLATTVFATFLLTATALVAISVINKIILFICSFNVELCAASEGRSYGYPEPVPERTIPRQVYKLLEHFRN